MSLPRGEGARRPARVRQAHIDWLSENLADRDRRIVADLHIVRLLTSGHIERLRFPDLNGKSRSVVRARVLKRLADWRAIVPLSRRIGGAFRGSGQTVWALDSAGVALMDSLPKNDGQRVRRPGLPGDRFIRHSLTVSELYVQLVEAERIGSLHLSGFLGEPAAWLPDGLGGWLKPDAYAVVASGDNEDHWAIEVDKATEHLPTIRRKLDTYMDFMRRGQRGQGDVMPRVLVTVPSEERQQDIAAVIAGLPDPASALFRVALESEAVPLIVRELAA